MWLYSGKPDFEALLAITMYLIPQELKTILSM